MVLLLEPYVTKKRLVSVSESFREILLQNITLGAYLLWAVLSTLSIGSIAPKLDEFSNVPLTVRMVSRKFTVKSMTAVLPTFYRKITVSDINPVFEHCIHIFIEVGSPCLCALYFFLDHDDL